MRQRDHDGVLAREATADARSEPVNPEQPLDREPTDRDDQLRSQELELPVPPEGAQLLLARPRRAVAAAGGRAAGIAARYRRAVERLVELLLVELEPAAKRLACTAAPGSALLALDDARRLAVHVRALARVQIANRQGL